MPSVRSVALGLFVGAGSRGEDHDRAGLAHFIEHLLFKGSARYGSHEIDEIFDAMGADLNAGTGKETTSVFARFLDQHVAEALDVLAEMVFAPAFRAEEVASEREVVIEEIAMYEDDPQDLVFDVMGEAVFGSHPLGRAVIGRAEVIAGTPVERIAAFHRERYVPRNVVVAAAGSLDHERLVELVAARVPALGPAPPVPESAPAAPAATLRFRRKDTEQYHLCLGAPGIAAIDERRFTLRVLDTIFGGTSSSRLFREIREQRGLAYAVHSFTSQYADAGQIGLYIGTRPENLAEVVTIAARELARLREEPVSAAELDRARENLKGRVVLSLESTGARMNRLGASLLAGVPLLSVDEVIEGIDAVGAEELQALAAELLMPERISAAGIGVDEQAFRASLAPLSEELAAAA